MDSEQNEKAFYLDQQDFVAKFLLNPDITAGADFSHIDKNLSMTRLASRWREPERARSILDSLHILNNPKYFRDVVVEEPTGEYETRTVYQYSCPICHSTKYSGTKVDNISCCGHNIIPNELSQEIPIMEKVIRKKSIFPRTYHNLRAKFIGFVTTSSARDGHLIRSATTTNINKSESVEDKTRAKRSPFFGKKNVDERY